MGQNRIPVASRLKKNEGAKDHTGDINTRAATNHGTPLTTFFNVTVWYFQAIFPILKDRSKKTLARMSEGLWI